MKLEFSKDEMFTIQNAIEDLQKSGEYDYGELEWRAHQIEVLGKAFILLLAKLGVPEMVYQHNILDNGTQVGWRLKK